MYTMQFADVWEALTSFQESKIIQNSCGGGIS